MTDAMLNTILKRAGAEQKGTKATLPEGRTLTFYVAHDGASMSASNIVATERESELLFARNKKGEEFVFALEDVFASSSTGASSTERGRKAGFLG